MPENQGPQEGELPYPWSNSWAQESQEPPKTDFLCSALGLVVGISIKQECTDLILESVGS